MMILFSRYPAFSCIVGAFLILVLAYALSCDRKNISLRTVFLPFVLQVLLVIALLKSSLGQIVLDQLVGLVKIINTAGQQGISFLFGSLGSSIPPWGFVFALHVLPIIIFFSALISLLSYLGCVGFIIRIFSYSIRPLLGTSSPETTAIVAKSFLGPTEAQLLVRDYLPAMSDSEIFAVMVSGLSMISASLFAIYIEMGAPGNHLITANLIGIPGSLIFAKLIMPETSGGIQAHISASAETETLVVRPKNSIEAIIQGSLQGLQLAATIGALLLSFISLIALFNGIFLYVMQWCGLHGFTFQNLIGYLFAPCALLLGITFDEVLKVSELIGIKFLANEMVAFTELARQNLTDRGLILATYALSGFANISCMGIVVSSLGTLVPAKRAEITSLAWYALLAATLSNLFSAYLVGIFL